MEPVFECTDRMSARALMVAQQSNLDFVESPRTGKLFFSCGEKRGYCSPAVRAKFAENSLKLEDLEFANVSMDGGKPVPSLMMKSTQNVKLSFKL